MLERTANGRQAEEWLRLAEPALGIGFWVFNLAEGRFSCSPGFCAMVGVNPAAVELDFMFFESLVHPRDRLTLDEPQRLATDGRQSDRRFRVIRPDGQLRWLHSRANSFFDRDGAVTRVVAVVADVTEEETARRCASNQRALLNNVSQLIGAALWIADQDGRLVDLFNAGGELALTAPNTPSGWLGVVHPEDAPKLPSSWRDAVAQQKLFRFEGRLKMPDGEYRHVHARALPFAKEYSSEAHWGGISSSDARALQPPARDEAASLLLTPGQVRACRALLDWTAETLAVRAGVSVSTVRRLEGTEVSQGQGDSMRLVMIAFQEAGLRIWRGDDGRLCVSDIR